jgi:hypothetical protein
MITSPPPTRSRESRGCNGLADPFADGPGCFFVLPCSVVIADQHSTLPDACRPLAMSPGLLAFRLPFTILIPRKRTSISQYLASWHMGPTPHLCPFSAVLQGSGQRKAPLFVCPAPPPSRSSPKQHHTTSYKIDALCPALCASSPKFAQRALGITSYASRPSALRRTGSSRRGPGRL